MLSDKQVLATLEAMKGASWEERMAKLQTLDGWEDMEGDERMTEKVQPVALLGGGDVGGSE